MTFTLQRRTGVLIGARCDNCKAPLDARTDRKLTSLMRGHQCPVRQSSRVAS